MKLQPEGNSWKLCLIGGCAYENGICFNCGKRGIDLEVNDVEALIAEVRKDARVFKGLKVGGLLDNLAYELEAANKRARLHAERANGLAEELDSAYSRIVNLTRALDN